MAKCRCSLMLILALVILSMPLESFGRMVTAPAKSRNAANTKSHSSTKSAASRRVATLKRDSTKKKTTTNQANASASKLKVVASKTVINKKIVTKKSSSASKSRKIARKHKSVKATHVMVNSKNYMWSEPWQDHSPYSASTAEAIRQAFNSGDSEKYSPQQLVKAGVFKYYPLSGGIFKRSSSIKNIVVHSTETARAADAKRVVRSWNIRGLRHAGAQYVVDRDGSIYQTVDPKFATVHVDINKTKYGVNNNNSIGIEIVRSGQQKYTDKQMDSVAKLVAYLQSKYDISRKQVVAHGYVQPSDRSDPVGFDWNRFFYDVAYLRSGQTTALKPKAPGIESKAGA